MRFGKILVVLAVLSLILISGCSTPANKIKVSGAFALYPLMVRWGEEYQKLHKDVRIDVSAGGAGKGMTDTLGGLVDIGMISREISPDEVGKGAFYVPVTIDAVFPIMNSKNTYNVAGSQEMFTALWINGTEVVWPNNQSVVVYTRSDSCGAAETWAKWLGNKKQEDLKGIAVYGDPGITEAVAKDVNGVGYNNLNYAFDSKTGLPTSGVKIVPLITNGQLLRIENKSQAVLAIQLGIYPSPPARKLYLATKGQPNNATKDFINWILNDGQKYVDEVGYVSLTAEDLNNARSKVGQ